MKKKKNIVQLSKLKKWFSKNWRRLVIILGILGLLVYFKSALVVAWVNYRPITRMEFNKELEKQAGKQVLDGLMTKKLISQEAKRNKIKVEKQELEEELKRVEELATQQGMGLDQLLELQGLNRQDLIEEIKLQKQIEKMIGSGVEVSEDEISEYYEKNMEYFSEEQTEEEIRTSIKDQLKQQGLSQKVQEWLGELQIKAKVVNWL